MGSSLCFQVTVFVFAELRIKGGVSEEHTNEGSSTTEPMEMQDLSTMTVCLIPLIAL